MCLEMYMLFKEVCTNIHGTLLIWKCWTMEKHFCLFKNVCSILIRNTKSESCLYQDSKCYGWQFDFLSENSRRLFEIARSFISSKQRISLKRVSVKIMILWNGKSIRTWDGESMSRKKSVVNVFRFLFLVRAVQVGMICAFNSLQVNTGRQKVCVNACVELSLML